MSHFRVGSNVDGWCTRCKLILAHTIEAVVGSDVKRVHCNTCKSKHVYRAHPPGEAPKSVSLKSASVTKKAPSARKKKTGIAGLVRASDYDTIMKGRDMVGAKRYSFRDRYAAGEVLAHNEFGVGVVTADKGSNKIEVLFQIGPKTLIHGRQA